MKSVMITSGGGERVQETRGHPCVFTSDAWA